jgi:hypothetical protein
MSSERLLEISFQNLHENVSIALAALRKAGYVAFNARKCGHFSMEHGVFFHNGAMYRVVLHLDEEGVSDWRTECAQKMTVTCAVTGKPILK